MNNSSSPIFIFVCWKLCVDLQVSDLETSSSHDDRLLNELWSVWFNSRGTHLLHEICSFRVTFERPVIFSQVPCRPFCKLYMWPSSTSFLLTPWTHTIRMETYDNKWNCILNHNIVLEYCWKQYDITSKCYKAKVIGYFYFNNYEAPVM